MDDMQAIEQRITRDLLRRAGPSEPVDDAAIFTAITATQARKWRFPAMFSAAKFVVAGAFVALVGGFLLAGVLTQPPSEDVPVVGVSAPPDATASPSVWTSTDELLAGMATETIEPGVYRVLSDGAGHDLTVDPWRLMDLDSIHATPDGRVWVNAFDWGPGTLDEELISLGVPGGHTSDDGYPGEGDLAVASDGTLWVRSFDRVASYDGTAWTVHRSDPDIDYGTRAMYEFSHVSPRLLVEADDTIWAGGWLGDVTDPRSTSRCRGLDQLRSRRWVRRLCIAAHRDP